MPLDDISMRNTIRDLKQKISEMKEAETRRQYSIFSLLKGQMVKQKIISWIAIGVAKRQIPKSRSKQILKKILSYDDLCDVRTYELTGTGDFYWDFLKEGLFIDPLYLEMDQYCRDVEQEFGEISNDASDEFLHIFEAYAESTSLELQLSRLITMHIGKEGNAKRRVMSKSNNDASHEHHAQQLTKLKTWVLDRIERNPQVSRRALAMQAERLRLITKNSGTGDDRFAKATTIANMLAELNIPPKLPA